MHPSIVPSSVLIPVAVLLLFLLPIGTESAFRPGFVYTRNRGRCTPQYALFPSQSVTFQNLMTFDATGKLNFSRIGAVGERRGRG
ncbi:hypothetical protein E3N88_11345 [Mikania micrantha]|uniref:Legume lectin domain-containing protein n=1 Tax=Mikania micrantha TaxID=192012 RepID=A0A5N6PF57_9ASTR|nr:hypothetical protein E3N88_11345 [Mikania micrantha]